MSGVGGGLRFPDICLTVEEEPRKNLNQENSPDRGSNPGPLGEMQRCYASTRAVVDNKPRIKEMFAILILNHNNSGSRFVDLRRVKHPQAEIRASEQNLSVFSRSMSEATLMI